MQSEFRLPKYIIISAQKNQYLILTFFENLCYFYFGLKALSSFRTKKLAYQCDTQA